MSLADTLLHRFDVTGGFDPDTLHGLLYIVERGAPCEHIAPLLQSKPKRVEKLLNRARIGDCGRVPASREDSPWDDNAEDDDGMLLRRWQRELVSLMLRPDGTDNREIEVSLGQSGSSHETRSAVRLLKADLKVLGVAITVRQIPGSSVFSYCITGNDAWRMQKIVANGWAL